MDHPFFSFLESTVLLRDDPLSESQFSIETLDAVKIPKRTTQACTSVKIKQAALEPGAKHTTTTYDLLDLAHAHAPANTTLDAGETADMVLIHPSNSDHALTVSGRGFDRVYLISPSDRVETEAHVDGLVHAGIQALNVPYTPREPQVGLGLQSLPFGFDSDDRLVEASFPRRRAAAYSDKEKGSLKAKSVSKTGTASVSKAVKTSRKEGSRKKDKVDKTDTNIKVEKKMLDSVDLSKPKTKKSTKKNEA